MKKEVLLALIKKWEKEIEESRYADTPDVIAGDAELRGINNGMFKCLTELKQLIDLLGED